MTQVGFQAIMEEVSYSALLARLNEMDSTTAIEVFRWSFW
jgi:hypothetical protein